MTNNIVLTVEELIQKLVQFPSDYRVRIFESDYMHNISLRIGTQIQINKMDDNCSVLIEYDCE